MPSGGIVSNSSENSTEKFGGKTGIVVVSDDIYKNTNYLENHMADTIQKNSVYTICSRDMMVKDVLNIDENSGYVNYVTLKKGTEVTVNGFANTEEGRFVILKTDDGRNLYENISDFYNNTESNNSSKFQRFLGRIYKSATMKGTLNAFKMCFTVAVILIISSVLTLGYFDTCVFIPSTSSSYKPELGTFYRLLPGALVGCMMTVINYVDENALAYYFYYGFNIAGKGYRFSHWVIQIVLAIAVLLIVKTIFESLSMFTIPSVFGRTAFILFINMLVMYVFNTLSFIGVLIFTSCLIYQCMFKTSFLVNSAATPVTEG